MTLAELLPDEDYRFQIRFEKSMFRGFFGPTDRNDSILAERKRWLTEAPQKHMAMAEGGSDLLIEAIECAITEQTLNPNVWSGNRTKDPMQRCIQLGQAWEPDFLLLKPDHAGEVRLLGGCVCFPSSWDLAEKIGHPIEFIHSVVPGLNSTLGPQIRGFLTKLKPGVVWLRANWGLSRSPELNQHPSRALPRLNESVNLDEVYLRVERQGLVSLPKSRGVLFGIRIEIHNLADIHRDEHLNRGMARALASLPEDMARYKNIAACRNRLLALLND